MVGNWIVSIITETNSVGQWWEEVRFPSVSQQSDLGTLWERCGRAMGRVGEQWVSPVIYVGRVRGTLTLLYLQYRLVPSNRCSQC